MTNETCCAVAMTTVLLLVLSKYKLKFLVFFLSKNHLLYSQNSTDESFDNVGTWSSPSRTPWPTVKGCKLGYLFLAGEGRSQADYHGNQTTGFILFAVWFASLVTSLERTMPIFLETLLNQYLTFPASRGLSRWEKLKREERDLCRLLMSCLMRPPTKFVVETYRFLKPVSFNVYRMLC